jgi:hypothetical protein
MAHNSPPTTEGRGKPSIKQVAEVLWLVAKFLAEFADVGNFHEALPRYLRKPLHLDLMDMMGLGTDGAATSAAPAAATTGGDGLPVQIDRASFRSKLFLLPLEPQDGCSAGEEEGEEEEDGDGNDDSSSTSSSSSGKLKGEGLDEEDEEEQRERREQEEAEARQRANTALIAHDASHYYLKRWVWMQFPWLVMANTALALRLFLSRPEGLLSTTSSSSSFSSTSSSTATSSSSPLPPSPGPQLIPRGRTGGADRPFRRLWAVKKVDPSRVVSSTADTHVLRTMVHSSVLHIAPHAETAERLAHAICAEDRVLSKEGEEDVPEEEKKEAAAAADEAAHTLLVTTGLPMTLQEKRLAESNKRVARLRSILDRVVEDRALMAAQLARLERAAAVRDQHDRAILDDIHEGELLVEALALRLRRLQDANTEAAALMAYYKVVISQCLEKNPVKDTKRMESVERQVALASFQLRSLIHQRDRVAGEHVAIEEEEIPKAQAQLEQIQQERARGRERLAFFKRRALWGRGSSSGSIPPSSSSNPKALMSMLTTTTLFLKGFLPLHGSSRRNPPRDSPDRASSTPSSPVPGSTSSSTTSSSTTSSSSSGGGGGGGDGGGASSGSAPKLTPYQYVFAVSRAQRLCAGMERLFELSYVDAHRAQQQADADGAAAVPAGPPAPEEAAGKIVHKFKNVRKLNHSFLAECRELEARIAELRGALQAQERKAAASSIDKRPLLDSVAGGGGGDGKGQSAALEQLPHREPGELEALIQEEEQRCARYMAMSATAQEMLDRVKVHGYDDLLRSRHIYPQTSPFKPLTCTFIHADWHQSPGATGGTALHGAAAGVAAVQGRAARGQVRGRGRVQGPQHLRRAHRLYPGDCRARGE